MLDTTANQVTQLERRIGTGLLKPHEEKFIKELAYVRDHRRLVTQTDKQLDWLGALHRRFVGSN